VSKDLNKEQNEAASAVKGPVLVIAGAGTGKTTVIVERIKSLVESGTPASRMLALTFTEKAAAEMLDRVNLSLDRYQLDLPIMTFNSYGESLLRAYAADIGLGRNFSVMGDSAQIVFMRERLDNLNLEYFAPVGRPDSLLGDISNYFSLLKQHVITPDMYDSHVKSMSGKDEAEKQDKLKHQELANAYRSYLSLCREANVIDYDDQLYLLIELLRRRPNILKEIQGRYDFVMVDEFQDTNTMQSVLVDLIASDHKNLFVVGDDDQSIYGWRGATLANILSFKERYPDAKEVTLLENYRSTQEILDSAYSLITNNNPHRLEAKLSINKKLVSDKSGPMPQVFKYETNDEELQWVAEDIKRRLDEGVKPGNIAVLARRNATIQRIRPFLEYGAIPYVVIGQGYELYHEPAVRTLLEALKAVADPLDNISLYHTLSGPLFRIPVSLLGQMASTARRQHQSLREVISASDDASTESIKEALRMIDSWCELSAASTVGKLAYTIIDETGYKNRLYGDPELAVAGTRLSELFTTFKQFEHIALQPTVMQYVEALPALQAAGEGLQDGTLDLSQGSVNLLTVHKSKGLEWDVVYIVDCTEGSFPVREMPRGIAMPDGLVDSAHSEADSHIFEERRLMYVAMTRARDELILTHAERHTAASMRKPSRFLSEAFGDKEPISSKPNQNPNAQVGSFMQLLGESVKIPERMLNNGMVRLNVSQAVRYQACPLDFYYRYILNVPQEPSPILEYGTLMHGLLQDINKGLMSGKPVELESLQQRLLQEWPKSGYVSAIQRERALEQGKRTLASIYERSTRDARVPIEAEKPFSIQLQEYGLTITGQIDAVFALGSGVEIVDYKTGGADTAEKAKSKAGASEQLTLYALAWQTLHDELPALVTLDFIDTGQKGSLKKTQRGIDGAKLRLQKVADGIRNQDFNPGKDHLFCIHPGLN